MKTLRLLLLPFSLLYWLITGIRNSLYNKGIFNSYTFTIPVLAVGNLSTGGTGKSPQTEYLIRLLSGKYTIAVLSRGYKRKSEGFVLADKYTGVEMLGDEPYQFYKKFPHTIIAVDANRKEGIEKLTAIKPGPEVILLDDAYQHRRVRAGLYILLTAYGDLYTDDYILPAGNLRESRSGAGRADIIVVTKCPPSLSEKEREKIIKKINPAKHQQVYFSYIAYDDRIYSATDEILVTELASVDKIIVAGIAKPEPFFNYIKQPADSCLTYPDHHNFTDAEITELQKLSENKIIVTTEKDYMRLEGKLPESKLYYLPIKTAFIENETGFNTAISEYIHNTLINNK